MNTNLNPASLGVLHAGTERYFGAPIGIMMLDVVAPMIPGSVGNASTYSAPVRYRSVPGLDVDEIYGADSLKHVDVVIAAARALEAEGARVISGNCGYFARYQAAVQNAVNVPVCLSSLLLVPFLHSMLPRSQKLGMLVGNDDVLTPEFIEDTGIPWDADRLQIAGLQRSPAFADAYIKNSGTADLPAIQREVVQAAIDLVAQDPSIGALLLECSELPSYAAVVQHETGLPVFDFTSMIEFFVAGLRRNAFTGFI